MHTNDDITQIVMKNDERLTDAEHKLAVHDGRIGILEKTAASMSLIPSTVAALGQKVESFGTQMVREIDGIREQHKAHQQQTEEKMEKGFTSLGSKLEALGGKVGGIALQDAAQSARQKGWWDVIVLTGQILLALAVIGEALKAIFTH